MSLEPALKMALAVAEVVAYSCVLCVGLAALDLEGVDNLEHLYCLDQHWTVMQKVERTKCDIKTSTRLLIYCIGCCSASGCHKLRGRLC